MSATPLTLLQVVSICDNARPKGVPPVDSPFNAEEIITFRLTPNPDAPAIGLLRPLIVNQLKEENERSKALSLPETWYFDLSASKPFIAFAAWIDTVTKRTEVMNELCQRWRDEGIFSDICGPTKWRAERYPIYKNPLGRRDYPDTATGAAPESLNFAFEMERSACALFGTVTYGVHMSIYALLNNDIKVWVPTRSKTKPTFPGLLDNSVAGGTPSGMGLFESIVKEAMEEASLNEEIIRKHAKATGVISYIHRTIKGWLQPEVEYTYDLVIPPDAIHHQDFTPKPNDGEVECFEFLDKEEILRRMCQGMFKPNCALVLIELFIKLGYITPESEEDYLEIVTRLHGDFDWPRW